MAKVNTTSLVICTILFFISFFLLFYLLLSPHFIVKEEKEVPTMSTKWKAVQINDYMYLGNKNDAENIIALKHNNITHILNVANNVPNYFPTDFKYKNLNVRDFGKDKGISRVFGEALMFMQNNILYDESKVLIHCWAGRNRSVTIVIYLLMVIEGKTLKEAYTDVKQKRPLACPYDDNKQELLDFEIKYLGFNSMNMEEYNCKYRN
eukprot:TRINITY_DN7764_c0_g1_i1.p1 TRINITY_DN7764_c0_g1~~TRINITY_DN7764_c0_g1_i1.p1  ORF type:complete len:207 (-),score=37.53 TRINITY_DN7764_c0_g1_i1:67-687(-)